MVELKGSLNSIGLPAIVQLIGELHHSGSLELSKGTTRGVLDFDEGRLVAADFRGDSGFAALAALGRELADAEFTFIEGAPAHQRTLDLASRDVQAYLSRAARGEDMSQLAEPAHDEPNGVTSLGTCPMLGFADDRTRHYSRSTAMHRCYASGVPSLVTGLEQRDLCLSGRYPACPRYRSASPGSTTAPIAAAEDVLVAAASTPDPVAATPTPLGAPTPDAVEPEADFVAPIPPHQVVAPSALPAGVVARMAVANRMHFADDDRPSPNGHGPLDSAAPAPRRYPRSKAIGIPPRRALLLIASGALVGLVLLFAVLLVSMRSLNGGLATQKPTVAGAQSFALSPTLTRADLATPPALVPTSAPAISAAKPAAPTAAPRPATPSVASRPAIINAAPQPSVTATGQTLLDVRFAAGPGEGWLNNPPFASWADGAFRLQAHETTRFVAVGAPLKQVPSDVIVSATFRKTGGPPGGGYGVIVRDQGPDPRDGINQTMSAYVFETGDLGDFGIWRRDADHWVDLVPWMRSAAVRPGGSPNDLLVRATGNMLVFSINGTQVASVQDDTLHAGGVGAFIGGDYNEVALDRFTVQVPD